MGAGGMGSITSIKIHPEETKLYLFLDIEQKKITKPLYI